MPDDTDFNFDLFLFDDDKSDEQERLKTSDKVLETKTGTVKEARAGTKEFPVEFTGNAMEDSKLETEYILGEFRKRMNREQQRREYTGDAEFFFCAIFQSKGQRDAFVEAIGGADIDGDNQFVDGIVLAEKFGIEIPKVDLTFRPPSIDPAFRDYTH